jgi:hypothetical protein
MGKGSRRLPKGLNFDPKWCSYIPPLLKAMGQVSGDVLELGAGIHSTFLLHWMCRDEGRALYTYENNEAVYNLVTCCKADFHHIHLIENWDDVKIERPWGVVLVDHSPAIRRKEDVKRLAFYAKVLLLHDSQGRSERHYRYSEVMPLFRYRQGYAGPPHTLLVSNFFDVTKWL